jgi:hypothetical protein
MVGATTVRAWETAARTTTALEDGVRDPKRHIVYSEPMLFDLTITFLIVRSNQTGQINIIGIHQAVALGLINPLPLHEAGNIISILVFTSPM